jgi:hypothetical protein
MNMVYEMYKVQIMYKLYTIYKVLYLIRFVLLDHFFLNQNSPANSEKRVWLWVELKKSDKKNSGK